MATDVWRTACRAGLTALVAVLWCSASAQAQTPSPASGPPASAAQAPPISIDDLRRLVDTQRALIDAQSARLDTQGRELEWTPESAVTVVLASRGYPESSSSGDVIEGLEDVDGVEVTHAGTALREGSIVTAGGRVLNITALGPSLEDARERAYRAVEAIRFDGAQYRRDIAAAAAAGAKLTTAFSKGD